MQFEIPTVDDLILYFTEREIIELTNLDNPAATVVNTDRLDAHMQAAVQWFVNYLNLAPAAARGALVFNAKRSIAIVWRYLADVYRTRDYVRQDFEDLQKTLDLTVNAYKYYRQENAVKFTSARARHNYLGNGYKKPVIDYNFDDYPL